MAKAKGKPHLIAEVLGGCTSGARITDLRNEAARFQRLVLFLNTKAGLEYDDPTFSSTALKAAKLARLIGSEREVVYDNLHTYPLELLENLVLHIKFSPDTPLIDRVDRLKKIIATVILYPMLRPKAFESGLVPASVDVPTEQSYFDRVDYSFRDVPGFSELVRSVLRYRDTHWMARIAAEDQTVPTGLGELGTEAQLFKNSRLMFHDITTDQDAPLIRLMQWNIYMHDVPLGRDAGYDDYCAFKLRHFYLPLAGAFGFKDLREGLENELFRRTQPEEYANVSARIREVENNFLSDCGHRLIDDENGRKRVVRELLLAKIEDAIPKHLRSMCEIEARIKKPFALFDKERRRLAENRDFYDDDILGVRVIIKSFNPHEEHADCGGLQATIKRALRQVAVEPLEGKEDNYMGINAKGKGQYEALHTAYGTGHAVMELQIVGANQHWNNCYGTASHGANYKTYEQEVAETTGAYVSVYAFGGVILRVAKFVEEKPITPRLLAHYLDPDNPGFSQAVAEVTVRQIEIDKVLRPIYGDNHLDMPLATGDFVEFRYHPQSNVTAGLCLRSVYRPGLPLPTRRLDIG